MKIKIKRLHDKAIIPKYAHSTDCGLDLTCVEMKMNKGIITYYTGLSIEIPEGYAGFIFPRSSIKNYELYLTNAVGVIDSGYRGEIILNFKPEHTSFPIKYNVGDRIGQLIILPYPKIEFEEAQELEESTRGTGAFGSTGL